MTLILAIAMISNVVTQGLAQASPSHGAIFEMVICAADGGEKVILVDAAGAIVPEEDCPHTACPDCLMCGAAALIGVPATFRSEARLTVASGPGAFPFVLQRRSGLPTARGPPQKV